MGLRYLNLLIFFLFLNLAYAEVPKKFGFIVPLTGTGSLMGKSLQGVSELASLQSTKVFFEDDQCIGRNALSAYQKLKSEGVKVFYIACSGSILAVAPLAKKNGHLIFSTYSASTEVRKLGSEVIRLNPDANSVAKAFLDLIDDSDKSIGVLYEQQDYAVSLLSNLKELMGSRIVKSISYASDARSLKSEIIRLKNSKIKSLIFIPVSDSVARIALKEIAELGLNINLYGEVNLCDYPFKPSDFGIHGKCLSATFSNKLFDKFILDYEKKIGYKPAYPFYDLMALDLLKFIDGFESKSADFSNKLRNSVLSGFGGAFVKYSFTKNGEAKNSGKYLKVVSY